VLAAFHLMYPEAPIHTMLAEPEIVRRHFPEAQIVTSSLQRSPLRGRPQLLVAAMPRAIEEFDLSGYDLVLSSSGAFSHGVVSGPDCIHMCYCHTPMRYAWDWHAEYLREHGWTGPLKKWLAETVISNIRVWDVVAAERPDLWIANSQTVRDRIKKYYGKVSTVVHPPVDTSFYAPQDLPAGGYAVTAGRLSAYKKVDEMIQACRRLGLPLRIVGAGEDRSRLERLAGPEATFLGGLSEEEKRREIAGAACFLFAAEDDFGIAPLEALAMGVPVVALGKGGALEYIEDGRNGVLYPDDIESGLKRFLDGGVSWEPARIRQSALRFGTDHFESKIRKLVDDALGR